MAARPQSEPLRPSNPGTRKAPRPFALAAKDDPSTLHVIVSACPVGDVGVPPLPHAAPSASATTRRVRTFRLMTVGTRECPLRPPMMNVVLRSVVSMASVRVVSAQYGGAWIRAVRCGTSRLLVEDTVRSAARDVLTDCLNRPDSECDAGGRGYADRSRRRASTGAHSIGWAPTFRNGSTGSIQPSLPDGAARSAACTRAAASA